ncbi:MAG: hypothetical protein SVN78_08265 [Deferribacterota bacterium]|nr:hypothetical protein [Deferribacterota bacterium]
MKIYIFLLLILLSIVISLLYIFGFKKNYKKIKKVANTLENILKPIDTKYTWLGGVIGFKANYKLEDSLEILLNYANLPRQSILYLPIALLFERYDRLELTMKLPKNSNINLSIKAKPLIDKQTKNSKRWQKIKNNKNKIIYFYFNTTKQDIVNNLIEYTESGLKELTIENNECYININLNNFKNIFILNNIISLLKNYGRL